MFRLLVELNLSTPEYRVEQTPRAEFPKYFHDLQSDTENFDANDSIQQLKSVIDFDVTRGGQLQDAAAKVKARALIVSSRHDHMVNPQPALKFAGMIGAQTLVLDGNCGHGAPMCEMDKVSPALDVFLSAK